MAVKKPIVLTNGEFEQLQAGDSLYSTDIQQMTNGNANAITIGQPVYVVSDDTVDLADADAAATKNVVGLVADASIAANTAGAIQSDGVLVSANWTAVTGGANLTAGDAYYLDDSAAGLLTATPPSAGGSYVAKVGRALNATEMEIEVEPTIKL